MRSISPYALRWLAAAGAAGAFVVGISAQAVRGHAGAPVASGDRVQATISDLTPVAAPAAAPALRPVALPALRNAPKPPRRAKPAAPPATSVLVAATPAPAATPVASAPPPAAPPVAAPQPKPSAPSKGPSFDSSG